MSLPRRESDRIPRGGRSATTRVVLFAHGSRDPRWRQTCEVLAERAAAAVGDDSIRLAYMQMAEPTLIEVARDAAAAGVEELRVVPLFFSAGGHVANDIPKIVGEVENAFPGLRVTVTPPVGEDPRFHGLVLDVVRETLYPTPPVEEDVRSSAFVSFGV